SDGPQAGGRRGEQLVQRRRAEVAAARYANRDAVDHAPAQTGAPDVLAAGDGVVDDPIGAVELQRLDERQGEVAAQDGDQQFGGELIGVVVARGRDRFRA